MNSLPVGLITWLLSALLAFAIGRAVVRRRRRFLPELLGALGTGVIAGMTATALNFGGWQTWSPHAAGLSFAASMAAVALVRLLTAPAPPVVDHQG